MSVDGTNTSSTNRLTSGHSMTYVVLSNGSAKKSKAQKAKKGCQHGDDPKIRQALYLNLKSTLETQVICIHYVL